LNTDLATAERLKNTSDAEVASVLEHIADDGLRAFLWDLASPTKPLDKYVAHTITTDYLLRTLAFRTVAHELWRRAEVEAMEQ
jgi:hypothetical protein